MSSLASDWQLRVSLCGDANVGKTSLFLRFSKEDECTEREITHETKKERTVGSDDSTKSFLVGRKSLRVGKIATSLNINLYSNFLRY